MDLFISASFLAISLGIIAAYGIARLARWKRRRRYFKDRP